MKLTFSPHFLPPIKLCYRSSAPSRSYSRKSNLLHLVERFASHGDRTAVISMESHGSSLIRRRRSFKDLDMQSNALADLIQSDIGPRGNPVVLLAPNSYDFAVGLTAIWKTGSPAVPLCNTHPSSEWEYYIEDSNAHLYLVHPTFASSMGEIASRKGGKVVPISASSTAHLDAASSNLKSQEWENWSSLFVYTSGTTGKPKGVVTTHANVSASVEAMVSTWQWSPSDHILHILPLHHVHGLVNALITPLSIGATVEMVPKFDSKLVWKRFLESHRARTHAPDAESPGEIITVFMAVPSIYVALINEYDAMSSELQAKCREALRPLRLMVSGSAALPEPILHRWEDISGHRLLERYGMTEIGMALTNPYTDHTRRKPGWVGQPFPGVEARIHPNIGDHDQNENATSTSTPTRHSSTPSNHANATSSAPSSAKPPTTGEPLPNSDTIIGELHIRGPQVFKEYWKKPDATKESFTSDGWFITGDAVEFNPKTGEYRILGRKSVDILKTGGYKVSALDIEAELLNHPSIREIAVVGIPDLEWGQIVGAIVALKSDANPEEFSLKALQSWCKSKLASYKIPRRLIMVPSIPRNAMGKVNKKELVKLFSEDAKKL